MNANAPRPVPVLNRVVSDPIFNDQKEALIWTVRAPHPLVPETYMVVGMFVDRGGVEIYAVSTDGKKGMRNLIPTAKVRFMEEAMPFDIFSDELDAAAFAMAPVGPLSVESDDDDDEDDEPDEPDLDGAAASTSDQTVS